MSNLAFVMSVGWTEVYADCARARSSALSWCQRTAKERELGIDCSEAMLT